MTVSLVVSNKCIEEHQQQRRKGGDDSTTTSVIEHKYIITGWTELRENNSNT